MTGYWWACRHNVLRNLETFLLNKFLKRNTICVQIWTYVGNIKGKRALFKQKRDEKNSCNCYLSWVVNSPSTWGVLGYHGVWIRAPQFPSRVKKLFLLYWVKLHHILVYSPVSFTASWSYHCTNWLLSGIHSASMHISYMGWQATLYAVVTCWILMYTLMGWTPAASIASTTKG